MQGQTSYLHQSLTAWCIQATINNMVLLCPFGWHSTCAYLTSPNLIPPPARTPLPSSTLPTGRL